MMLKCRFVAEWLKRRGSKSSLGRADETPPKKKVDTAVSACLEVFTTAHYAGRHLLIRQTVVRLY